MKVEIPSGLIAAFVFAALIALFLKSDADPVLMLTSAPAAGSQKGTIVWITGASSGLGAAMAIDLCKGNLALQKLLLGWHMPYILINTSWGYSYSFC